MFVNEEADPGTFVSKRSMSCFHLEKMMTKLEPLHLLRFLLESAHVLTAVAKRKRKFKRSELKQ